jgi:hypothetical protein
MPLDSNLKNELRVSIARTKSSGDKGLPCGNPLAWQVRLPGCPLRRILVLPVESRIKIQFIHLRENPICCRRSRIKGQLTKSKAFAKSTLRSKTGCPRACKSLAAKGTVKKLSCIVLPTLVGRNQPRHEWHQLVGQNFSYELTEAVYKTYGPKVSDIHGILFFAQEHHIRLVE